MNLIESFSEFKAGKNIDRPTMVRVMEDVFRTLIKKKYGSDEHFDIIVNTNGDLQLWRVRKIVPDGEVMDEQAQVSLSEAKSIDVSYELDEECYEELTLRFWSPRDLAARQTLVSRIMELEKTKYSNVTKIAGEKSR
jgi:N utilization substance protein A